MVKEKRRVAIVTGGAKNIGRETCISLARLNFDVIIHANTDEKGAILTQKMVTEIGVNSKIVLGDLTKESFVKKLINSANNLGVLSVLINNASQRNFKKFEHMSFKDWRYILSINLDSIFLTCKYALPLMLKNNWGRIVNLGGLSAHIGAEGRAHVITSKSAVVGLTRALAIEYAKTNVTINAVIPGIIDTIRTKTSGKGLVHPNHTTPPKGRKGYTAEVASMIKYLCDNNSDFITGQAIHVNGGSYLSS